MMKRSIFLLALLPLMASGSITRSGALIAMAPGDAVPTLRGYLPDGNYREVDWSDNRLTLVNFWATWCEPCRREMPALDKIQAEHRDAGFEVIGVWSQLLDIDPDKVEEFLEETKPDYDILRAHRFLDERWLGIAITPTSYLITEDGKILRRYVGATEEQTAGLANDVAAYLRGHPLPTQVVPAEPDVQVTTEEDRPRPDLGR